MNDTMTAARTQTPFVRRHVGPSLADQKAMLEFLGFKNLDEMIAMTVPRSIRTDKPLNLPKAAAEHQALAELKAKFAKNKISKSYIGLGYFDCHTPGVIQRNILENPGWYTQYTPYQAEIAQGRLEALVNYQTMVSDLTGLPIANASLLDEGTAAAEAMTLLRNAKDESTSETFYIAKNCLPHTIEVVKTRAEPLGIKIKLVDPKALNFDEKPYGILLQYPAVDGEVTDYADVVAKCQSAKCQVVMACDLLALTVLKTPGELGADVAVGTSQRFGVPLGFGGPHAAFFATKDEHKRRIPGRLVGVSKDAQGHAAFRLALQTREQHIRRDKATSNICTAQVLLAIMASMYAVYHGPQGLKNIALKTHANTKILAAGLKKLGLPVAHQHFFDTVSVKTDVTKAAEIVTRAEQKGLNFRTIESFGFGISCDETTELEDIAAILDAVKGSASGLSLEALALEATAAIPAALERKSEYLTHPVFNSHHSESEMLRYIRMLESRDLSLTRSMIPLGSCTMKLNATSELYPVTWAEVGKIHPFAPKAQTEGYLQMFKELEAWIAECTGFDAVSLQPNSGAQGEYAGLLTIRKYHQSRGDHQRKICLIPSSAHGTNPASAALAGMQVVVVKCDADGNIDVADLKQKTVAHAKDLAALMVTYPSTHGVFEEGIRDICDLIHQHGGLVYMDGANLNAQIGLCKPGTFGPDVCHLNLHKTFCIPHGGGGPGMGPIAVNKLLAPFLPGHPLVKVGGDQAVGPISAAPWGSASILPISWMYIRMMGPEGLTEATKVAILNANYIAKRLGEKFPIVYKGREGMVAHECIIDLSSFKKSADIEVDDIAKRLIDYGFHAPTVSFPVPLTMMVEPTESEPKAEIDRFCDAMLAIRAEIAEIESGKAPRTGNVLKNAPHTANVLIAESWDRSYSREKAVFPAHWVKMNKFWPHVGRIDNAYGDRNLICTCPAIEEYT